MKSLLRFYIDASIHVAFAVFALTYVCLTKFDLPFDEVVLGFNFFGTLLGYNFVKYGTFLAVNNRGYSVKLKLIILLSLLAFLALIFYSFQLEIHSIYLLIIAFVITAFYGATSAFFKRKVLSLRNVPGLKIFVIALVWSIVIVLFPVLQSGLSLSISVFILMLQVFLMVVALMFPFEIRDLDFDNKALHTLPQTIGVSGTKLLGFILGVIIIGLELVQEKTTTKQLYVLIVVQVILMLAILFSKKHQTKFYSSFFVEAIPILWMLLLLILF